jgi:rhodanese-related sulfurtransferase
MDVRFSRLPHRSEPSLVPRALKEQPGLFVVDATWGEIQPLQIASGVETVGELELIDYLRAGRRVVDCRTSEHLSAGTIPCAVNLPHDQIVGRIGELDPEAPSVLFCNGPQCTQTGRAIAGLLAAGWPAERLLYYRGGIHDWVTLGLPLTAAHTEP